MPVLSNGIQHVLRVNPPGDFKQVAQLLLLLLVEREEWVSAHAAVQSPKVQDGAVNS